MLYSQVKASDCTTSVVKCSRSVSVRALCLCRVPTATSGTAGIQRQSVRYPQVREYFFLFRISLYHIVNSVCYSHALVSGPPLERPVSDGGLFSGQLLMMWSAVCSGSPHSHAALSASPHFFMDDLSRPTPVCRLFYFRVVHCFVLRSSYVAPSSWCDMW